MRRRANVGELPSVTLPAGSKLFHGSIEKIKGRLRPGGDHVLWFADSPVVAQLYLPRSGMTMMVAAESLTRPTQDEGVREVQKMIGIRFDYDAVEWDPKTGRAKSWPSAPGWEWEGPGTYERHLQRAMDKMAKLGYVAKSKFSPYYEIHFADDEILPPGGTQQGVLCVAKTLRDMTLWAKALGEGDLMNVQYHDVKGFALAQKLGYDGVIIDDFAQSEAWGNLGHLSVGLFEPALKDIDYECVPATYEEFAYGRKQTKAWPHEEPMYFRDLLTQANPAPKLHRLAGRLAQGE